MMNLRQLRPDQQQKQKPLSRFNYHQHTKNFVGWVNKFGIERTFIGRLAHFIDSKFKVRTIALVFLFCIGLSFFIYWDYDLSSVGYKEGELASSDIKSSISFEVIDEEKTAKRRFDAEDAVPLVYDFDTQLYFQINQKFRRASREMPRYQADFEIALGGIPISKESFQWLLKNKFKSSIENAVSINLERWGNQKIIDDLTPLRQSGRDRIVLEFLEKGQKHQEFLIETRGLLDVSEVRKRLANQTSFAGFTKHQDIIQLSELIRSLIVPNVTLNKQETELRKQKARELVSPVVAQVKKGQTLVRSGAPVDKIQITMIEELRKLQATRHQDLISLITALFLFILLVCYANFLGRFTSKVKVSFKDIVAMGIILLTVLVMAKFTMFVANTALIEKFSRVPASFYAYLVPVSAGAMMVGLIIPFGEVVWLFSMFMAVCAGLLLDRNFGFMVVTFTSSIIAARGVYGCKKREDLYWAGIKTGLLNAALIFCITLINKPNPELLRLELLWNTPAGFLSGFFASFVTLTLVPFLENIFVYTTDIKLLELSNLNHPLLKELVVKAPGTYHHSLVVGSMCEAAAELIGANPLLAKVCAYYHDIGKTHHAQYFIENQRQGENRHDQINPGMSKTVLIAHVKDGVEMGLEYKLGQPIIDVIEQHHGTTLISFFYHKAKEQENTEMHEVSEDEYRYPGPKPQFREAALCMLGDSIEAAARSLDEPTPARLQNIVRNIIQKKFLDGQLDECNLTLKDLSLIEEAFSRTLLSIYHHRIDYPTTLK